MGALSVKTIVILHNARGNFPDCTVGCQIQKPHYLVEVLCSLTALGFGAIRNPCDEVRYICPKLNGYKSIPLDFCLFRSSFRKLDFLNTARKQCNTLHLTSRWCGRGNPCTPLAVSISSSLHLLHIPERKN